MGTRVYTAIFMSPHPFQMETEAVSETSELCYVPTRLVVHWRWNFNILYTQECRRASVLGGFLPCAQCVCTELERSWLDNQPVIVWDLRDLKITALSTLSVLQTRYLV